MRKNKTLLTFDEMAEKLRASGIEPSPALVSVQDHYKRYNDSAALARSMSSNDFIHLDAVSQNRGRTHGIGSKYAIDAEIVSLNRRLREKRGQAISALMDSITDEELDHILTRAKDADYINSQECETLRADIKKAGSVGAYFAQLSEDMNAALAEQEQLPQRIHSRAGNMILLVGDHSKIEDLMEKISILYDAIGAKEVECPNEIINFMADKVFKARGINIPDDPAQRRAEMTACGDTSLHMHDAAFKTLLSDSPGKTVLIPEGFFESLVIIPSLNGGNVQAIPTHDIGYKLTAERLEEILNTHPKGSVTAVLLTIPSNPLGLNYSEEELKAIGKVAVEHGLKIVVDEHFAGLCHDEKSPAASLASLTVDIGGKPVKLYDHTLTLQGTTKLFDFEKSKCGVACSGDRQWIAKIKQELREQQTTPNLHEVIDTGFLMDNCRLADNNLRLGHQYHFLKRAIAHANHIAGQEVFSLLVEPQNGFFTVLTMPKDLAAKVEIKDDHDFYLYSLMESHVVLRPIDGMGFTLPDKVGARINFSAVESDAALWEAFSRLGQMAKKILSDRAPTLSELKGKAKKDVLQHFQGREH